jgi:probable phosphoglycerate mutase
MMEFLLIRHASTPWNEEKRIQGQKDIPLSPQGVLQARGWCNTLQRVLWSRVLCSDLQRAVDTAHSVNNGRESIISTDRRLREQDWGRWTGCTIDELHGRHAAEVRLQENAGWNFRPPGGESRTEVLRRTLDCLEETVRNAAQSRTAPVLVVTHLGVIKCLVTHLMGLSFTPDEPSPVKKRALHRIGWDGRTFTLLERNRDL